MVSKTKAAVAALLLFGSASVVLADTNDRTDHHDSSARRAVSVTFKDPTEAVKPFAVEAKTWFAAPRLALVQSAPFCLKSATSAANCIYHTLMLCEQARHPNSLDQCIPRFQAGG